VAPPPLGRTASLRIQRLAPQGAYLSEEEEGTPDAETLLLPRREVPEGARPGDPLDVFVYLDSADRPIATTAAPRLELGEVGFLEVTSLAPFGAFVDWGLPKELLVPFAEQTRELRIGERHPFGVYLDETGRLAGTMRISEMLADRGSFEEDEWVEGEAWRKEPGLGIFVIVERRFVGLVPETEPLTLGRGDAARFRIANVLADGKLELSLRRHAHEELEADAARILEVLRRPDAPTVQERSPPERIRALFGLSRKAFKRAIGRLLSRGDVTIDTRGSLVVVKP
jgi:uncharacterized protein